MLSKIIALLVSAFGRKPGPAPTAPEAVIPVPAPKMPAAKDLPGVDMAALKRPHGAFDSKAKWCLTPTGLAVNGVVKGTAGQPLTVLAAINLFLVEFRAAAKQFGVPIELLIACACAEAGVDIRKGRDAARLSERREPGFSSYEATPHRVSIGVMHTLLSTARSALFDPGLQPTDLRTPSTSIRAGAAYIASQKAKTGYDPPLVGAAYNAGGVYDDPTPGLPFSLRDYPAGEDRHVERFVAFFNDVCRLVNEDPSIPGSAPSFMRALS